MVWMEWAVKTMVKTENDGIYNGIYPRNIDIGTLFEFWSGNWVRWLQKKGQQKKE